MSGLPRGWVEATVSEVGSTTEQAVLTGPFGASLGKADFRTSGVPVLTIGCLGNGYIIEEKLSFISDQKAEELAAYRLREGDLMFSRMATVGRVGFVPPRFAGSIFNYHLMRLRLCDAVIEPRFFYHYVRGAELVASYLADKNRGATRDGINTKLLEQLPISLPPLAEQKRIVAKLDALNAKSARARTELARIETLVSRYKQAVLSKAFSGELNASQTRLGTFIQSAGNGLAKREGEEGDWINVLRLTDLNQGHFSPASPRQIRLSEKEIKKYRLSSGDFVIIRVNGSANLVGMSFRFESKDLWAFCDHFIRIILKPPLDGKFAALFLNSPPIRAIIEHKFVSTSGQKTISQKTLEDLPVPETTLEEQHEIVRRIESAFARIDRLAGEAKRALALVGRLDEAILAKAFRGELVPQDETDEPADRLLARIRAERQAAPKVWRGRRAKA